MKKIYILSIVILVFSCTNKKTNSDKIQSPEIEREIVVSEFQTLIDSADVKGSILIYDLKDDKYYSNNFNWAKKGYLPASTYKITNSIIALETGVVQSDSTLFKWNGEERRLKIWEQDMIFKDALYFLDLSNQKSQHLDFVSNQRILFSYQRMLVSTLFFHQKSL